MKKTAYLLLAVVAVIFSASCSKKLTALDSRYFKATPNPLEVNGGKIDTKVDVTFPQEYFSKNAIVSVTPVLRYNGKDMRGNSTTFQGEKILGNDHSISYKAGGKYTIESSYNYNPEMSRAELYLDFSVKQKKKNYRIPEVKVAEGVNTTATLFSTSTKELAPAVAANKFKRVTEEVENADILFLIQQAQLRNSELKKEDVIKFANKIKEARDSQNKDITELQVLGYASPDGSMELNSKLAEKRQKVTTDYIDKELKKLNANIMVDSKFTAEDWDGFQKLMENSNIQDKELILRVLSMYTDPEQREREIKNLSSTFNDIANQILPQLRRSRLKLKVNVEGKTDNEIRKIALNEPNSLTAEELLYAGTLMESDRFKSEIYESFIAQNPTDARGYNNLATVKYDKGDIKNAETLLIKATKLDNKLADAYFNLGLICLKNGQLEDAEINFGKATATNGNLSNALGTTYIAQGNYDKAANALSNQNTNNAVLIQIINKNYNNARQILKRIEEPTALTAYLAAVLSARTNDRNALYENLKTVVKEDRILGRKAMKDIEFVQYFKDNAFMKIFK